MRLLEPRRRNLATGILLTCSLGFALLNIVQYDPHEVEAIKETAIALRGVLTPPSQGSFSPAKLRVELSKERFKTLRGLMSEAQQQRFIGESQKKELPGKFIADGERYRVKIRLKGDWTDHLGEFVSLRLAIRGDKRFEGLREWNLQNPASRNFLFEWLLMRALEDEGILVPRHEFVNLQLQDRQERPYLLIEHFSKELVERQSRREGLILHLREGNYFEYKSQRREEGRTREGNAEIAAYSQAKAERTPHLARQWHVARTLMDKFRSREIPPSQVFDVEKIARMIALYDVFGAGHGFLWFNMRFYYNPVLGRFETIAYDGNAGRVYSETELPKRYAMINHVMRDPIIREAYERELKRVSDPEYLRALFEREHEALQARHLFLEKHRGYRGNPSEMRAILMGNAAWLREKGVTVPHPERALPIPAQEAPSFVIPNGWAWEKDDDRRWLIAAPGATTIEQDWLLPEGAGLRLGAGTHLRIGKNRVIAVRGPVEFLGTETEPVILEAAEDEWGGLVVIDAKALSTLKHVHVSDVSPGAVGKGPEREGWFQTGGVNFAYSDLHGEHLQFRNFRTEDALNVVGATVDLSHILFDQVASDAFDGDFIQGELEDFSITHVGGDGLDFSGSKLRIRRIHATHVADKAVSVGEESQVELEDLFVSGGAFGLVAKDGSHVEAKQVAIEDTRIGIATYTKKAAFGPARLDAWALDLKGESFGHLAQSGSTLTLDGRRLPVRDFDSADLYAGEK